MATPVLIGVGGTGQTVLAAYLRLASMAGFTPASFFVLDSDTRGPLGKRLTGLSRGVREVQSGKELPDRWMIDPFPTEDVGRKTFGSLFGHLVGDRRDLFECLFSAEAEQTPIRTGMYGRPSVGATCIRYKLHADDEDLGELKETLRGGEKHVVLVGSCFGGTGSGGVPMLAAELDRLKEEEQGFRLKVDALVFLPWFRLVAPQGGLKAEEKALSERLNRNFESNAAAGIYYFKDQMREKVDSLILLGVPDRSAVTRASSEAEQEEEPHILNLLAAILVQNQFAGSRQAPLGLSGYWYDPEAGLSPDAVQVLRGGASRPLTLLQVIHRAHVKHEWLGILGRFFENFLRLPKSVQPLFLRIALRRLQQATRSEEQVVEALARHFREREEEAAGHLEWVERMADPEMFPLRREETRIQSDRYDELVKEPLEVLATWCDTKKLVASFDRKDFGSTAGFGDKFSALLIHRLMNELSL